MFLSDLGGMPVIDDRVAGPDLFPVDLGRGYAERDWSADPYGSVAAPFPLPVIPRSEWADRLEEKTKRRATLRDVKRWAKFESLNQQQTNYCWANGPVAGLHYVRAMMGLPHVPLSPASVAAPIKNYRNVGGWGSEALKYIIEHGVAPQRLWPANAISREHDNEESREVRMLYRVLEWWELKPRNFDELATCMLYGIPAAVGYNWWGHEVLAIGLVRLGADEFGLEIDNSWGSNWGENGHAVLKDSKMIPDEAVAPRVMVPSMLV